MNTKRLSVSFFGLFVKELLSSPDGVLLSRSSWGDGSEVGTRTERGTGEGRCATRGGARQGGQGRCTAGRLGLAGGARVRRRR